MLKIERIDEHKNAEEKEEVCEVLFSETFRVGFHLMNLYTNYDIG